MRVPFRSVDVPRRIQVFNFSTLPTCSDWCGTLISRIGCHHTLSTPIFRRSVRATAHPDDLIFTAVDDGHVRRIACCSCSGRKLW